MTDDQTGIPISKEAFSELVRTSVKQMAEAKALSERECIAMVRVYNTVALIPDAKRSEEEATFLRKFAPKYLKQAVDKLDASLAKGMAYYSAKFDLDIGGNPNRNSRFSVER
jgi:hypothetical protein